MPTLLNSPTYGASRDGLVARYSTSFTGDLQLVLPLEGTFQGDPVSAVSLLIDNYNNAIQIAYTIGGDTYYVPAYTSMTIRVTGAHTIILAATDFVSINLAVYNTQVDINRSRGIAPNGVSDPMWANVLGLWHFDQNPGAKFAIDSKNSGQFTGPANVPIISNTQSLFGGTSGICNAAYTDMGTAEQFYASQIIDADYTWELSVFPVTAPGVTNQIAFLAEQINGKPYDGYLSLNYSVSAGQVRFEVWRTTNFIAKPVVNTLLFATPFSFPLNAWSNLALTTLGGLSLYVNGVFALSGNSRQILSGLIGLWYRGSGWNNTPPQMFVDEMRLTVGTRYIKNYTPATGPFPNQ